MRRTITKSTWAEIHTAYASGIPLREIARNMGISEGRYSLTQSAKAGQQIQSAKALAEREDALLATPVESCGYVHAGTRRTPRRANGGRLRARR